MSLKVRYSAAKIIPMFSKRSAVAALFALFTTSSTVIFAQQGAQTHLTIKVTDKLGAPIPGAQINVMSSPDDKLLTFAADIEGIANLPLKPGEYQYRVGNQGFCPKNGTVTIGTEPQQNLSAELVPGGCPGPCATPCVEVSGAPPMGPQVTIKVTNPDGAAVSAALIEIDPSSAGVRRIKTDTRGQAVVGIRTGMHSLRVSAPGFRAWNGFAEGEAPGMREVITARLEFAEKRIQGPR